MNNKLKKEYDLIRFTVEQPYSFISFFKKIAYNIKTLFKESEKTIHIKEIESIIDNKPEVVFSYELWHYVNGKKHEICFDPYKKN